MIYHMNRFYMSGNVCLRLGAFPTHWTRPAFPRKVHILLNLFFNHSKWVCKERKLTVVFITVYWLHKLIWMMRTTVLTQSISWLGNVIANIAFVPRMVDNMNWFNVTRDVRFKFGTLATNWTGPLIPGEIHILLNLFLNHSKWIYNNDGWLIFLHVLACCRIPSLDFVEWLQ